MSVCVSQCGACGHRVYPARLWCPACGHDQSQSARVDHAELAAWTVMPQQDVDAPPVIIATVRALPQGPVMVVRLEQAPTHMGQRLVLFERQTQERVLPWARTLPD